MARTKTIAVIDDEQNIVDVVKSYLEKGGYKVVSAGSGGEVLKLVERAAPDLIVLDLMLPEISGEDLCRAIRKKSRVPILMLTAKTQEESLLEGLAIGADDYMTKPFSPRELMARVEALLRRTAADPVPLYDRISMNGGDLVVDNNAREIRRNGALVSLTPDEYDLFMTFLKYPTRVFTREQLIDAALGDDFDGYDRIIDTHIKNIRQKIEPNPKNPRYILTVHGVGYRYGGELDEN